MKILLNKRVFVVLAIVLFFMLFLTFNLVNAEENISQNSEEIEDIEVQISQETEKYLEIQEGQVLLQQKVGVAIGPIDELNKERESIFVTVPQLEDKLPEVAIVLFDGQKLTENAYTYDSEKGQVEIEISKDTNVNNWNTQNEEYKIIYIYTDTEVQESIEISSEANVEIKLENNDTNYTNENIYTQEITPMGNKISNNGAISAQIYKGYMYAHVDKQMDFIEQNEIEISNLQEVEEINLTYTGINFVSGDSEYSVADEYVYITNTIINKQNMLDLLGENGEISILNENNEVIYTINKDSEENEHGNIEISYGTPQLAKNIRFNITKPEQIGTLRMAHAKYIQTNTGYSVEQLQQFITLEETIQVNDNESRVSIALQEPKSVVSVATDKEQIDAMTDNNEMELNITLHSNEPSEKLFNNPYIEIAFPSQIENISLREDAKILYEDELRIREITTENNVIRIYVEGTQTNYSDGIIEGAVINLKLNIGLNSTATNSEENIQIRCINQGEEISVGQPLRIESPKEIITVNSITDLNVQTIGKDPIQEVEVSPSDTQRVVKVQSSIIVNKDNMKNVSIVGELPTNENTVVKDGAILENNMGMQLVSNVTTNDASQTVYYTNNPDATSDLNDPNNGWKSEMVENPCKYLITEEEMNRTDTITIEYDLQMASEMEYNQTAYQGYYVEYENGDQGSTNIANATYLEMTTGQGPVLEVNLSAMAGNGILNAGDTVKRGQVIRYIAEITNTGSEAVDNVLAYGTVSEGLTFVEPMEDYPYHGGEYYVEVEQEREEFTIDHLEVGESVQRTYEVRVDSDASIGATLAGTFTIEYGEVQKEDTFENVIADGKLRISIKSNLDDASNVYQGDIIEYQAIIENISNETQENVNLTWHLPEVLTVKEQSILVEEPGYDGTVTSETETIALGSINAGEKAVVNMLVNVGQITGSIEEISLYAEATQGSETYISNNLAESVNSLYNVDVTMRSNNEGEYLLPGDEITYEITLVNNNAQETSVLLYDTLPSELSATEIYVNGEQREFEVNENNRITISSIQLGIDDNKETIVEIRAVVDYQEGREDIVEITNSAEIYIDGIQKTSNQISHMIEYQTVTGAENIDIKLETNNEGQYVHAGDEINYRITITNNNRIERQGYFYDTVPSDLTVTEVTVNGEPQTLGENPNDIEILNMQLGTGENKDIVIDIKATVNNRENMNALIQITNTAYINVGGEEKASNSVSHTIEYKTEEPETDEDVSIQLSADHLEGYVKENDIITYTIIVTNNTQTEKNIRIYDAIPEELTVTQLLLNGEEQSLGENVNIVDISDIMLGTGENGQVTLEIRATVDQSSKDEGLIQILNIASVYVDQEEIRSGQVAHIIEYEETEDPEGPEDPDNPDPEDPEDPDNPDNPDPEDPEDPDPEDPDNPDNPDNPDPEDPGEDLYTYNVGGKVWLDENENGEMQDEEEGVSDIRVYLIDTQTGEIATDSNGNSIETVTNAQGRYTLTDVENGTYLVAFDYDTSIYQLTTYMQNNVQNSRNSKVISRTMTINGQEKVYGVTDTINVQDGNVANIHMGLVTAEIFDLQLNKYVRQVVVEENGSRTQYDYNNTKITRVDLNARTADSANITVTYEIDVTNIGEIPGYVRDVVDYLPEGLTFSSQENTGWYLEDNELHNSSLANEAINPGETKTLTLVLRKSSDPLGTYSNMAELGEVYNENNITDINSTPGNGVQGENDMSTAELIVSIRTGRIVMYIGLTITLVSIIFVGVYFIKKKVLG